MIKKALVLVVAAVFCAASFAIAADKTTKAAPAAPGMTVGNTARQMPPRPEFAMISGKIEKIDSSDPKNVMITVKNDRDGSTHSLSVMPWTNITRSAELSELKSGDKVRVMSRKTADKEVAMGIMFGKIKNIQAPLAVSKASPAPSATATKAKK